MQYRAIRIALGISLLLGLWAGVAGAAGGDEEGLTRHTLIVGELERVYTVYLPGGDKPSRPLPVVFLLHGAGGAGADAMSRRFNYNALADREQFIVVYPHGVGGQWNDGREKSLRLVWGRFLVDDVAYFDAVIEDLVEKYAVDRSRIYVTGMSNGGMMVHRLGIELGSKIAAIAPMISNLPANLAASKVPVPMPVLIINSTEDPLVPYEGGELRTMGMEFGEILSTEKSVRYWVENNGIESEPTRRTLPERDSDEDCRVDVVHYRKADSPVEVILYTLHGGGHNIPGSDNPDMPRLLGKKCMTIKAHEVIWQFFKRHTRSDLKAD